MSISPPSDILLGVANAADPQKYRAAVEKLARASGASPAEAGSALTVAIGDTIAAARAKPGTAAATPGGDPSGRITSAFRLDQVAKAKQEPHKEFEAFFLQTAIESMLPKDSKTLFGSGPAGEIWKSMLAEQIARELAQSTSFGIAEQIAEHSKAKKKKEQQKDGVPVPAAALLPDDAATAQAAGLGRLGELRKLFSAEGQIALGSAQPAQISTGSG